MVTKRQRLKHFLTGSRWVRREVRAITNFAHFAHTRNVFTDKDIDLVLDVGANCGQFASEIRTFYKGEILSFEPVSLAFEELRKAASGDSQWKCFKLALGSKAGNASIRVAQGTELSSFLKPTHHCHKFGDQAKKVGDELVSVRRLDEFLTETVPELERRRIFLKVDTQGFDIEVIKGLGEDLHFISALQSEVSIQPLYEGMSHWTENIAMYERAGFSIAGMFPVTLDSLNVVEFDCLMVRNEDEELSEDLSDPSRIPQLAS
jgi:FkbM family methyltransferase